MESDHESTEYTPEERMPEYTPEERALLAALPRERPGDPATEGRLVEALAREGWFRPARPSRGWLQAVAAIALLFLGGVAGARFHERGTLEAMIDRDDLSANERVLVLQRAGSAYVRAAHAYADAVAETDSTAVEVASQVLIGAAQAVARSDLDGGLTPRLTAVLASGSAEPDSIIWY
jgi:hypothetical protein